VIQSAATLLGEAAGRLVRALSGCQEIGHYEADVECLNLLKLIVRHVESVTVLALRDLVLLPSAMGIARAAYETTIKLLWMAAPDEPFEREIRWLAHLQSEEDYYLKIASQLTKLGHGDAEQKTGETIRRFRNDVAAKLHAGYTPLKQLPNLYQMLESLGEERKYLMYITGCQFAHGTHYATGLYRKHLGTEKVLGEHIAEKDWAACFSMTWYSLHASGECFLLRAGGNPRDFLSVEFGNKVQAAIHAITERG
jgi:hypothetical protein